MTKLNELELREFYLKEKEDDLNSKKANFWGSLFMILISGFIFSTPFWLKGTNFIGSIIVGIIILIIFTVILFVNKSKIKKIEEEIKENKILEDEQ